MERGRGLGRSAGRSEVVGAVTREEGSRRSVWTPEEAQGRGENEPVRRSAALDGVCVCALAEECVCAPSVWLSEGGAAMDVSSTCDGPGARGRSGRGGFSGLLATERLRSGAGLEEAWSVCVAMVVVLTGRWGEAEGNDVTSCSSWLFSLITSS